MPNAYCFYKDSHQRSSTHKKICVLGNNLKNLQIYCVYFNEVTDIHFLKSMPAESIAYRSVATALSDIAAMGGNPVAFNLSLVMPSFESSWMEGFKKGLQKISREFHFPLIGGDLVKGPLQISVTVLGKPEKNILLSPVNISSRKT